MPPNATLSSTKQATQQKQQVAFNAMVVLHIFLDSQQKSRCLVCKKSEIMQNLQPSISQSAVSSSDFSSCGCQLEIFIQTGGYRGCSCVISFRYKFSFYGKPLLHQKPEFVIGREGRIFDITSRMKCL